MSLSIVQYQPVRLLSICLLESLIHPQELGMNQGGANVRHRAFQAHLGLRP